MVHWLKLGVFNAVTRVQSLVKELLSPMPRGMAPNKGGGCRTQTEQIAYNIYLVKNHFQILMEQ